MSIRPTGSLIQTRRPQFSCLAGPRVRPKLVCLWLISVGPGRWSGQSGKELVFCQAFLHPETERQATEVGRYGSGVWLKRRSLAWSQVPCAEQWLTVGETRLIPFGRVSS